MKKSLFWRAVLIVAVIIAWSYMLYPLQDQDYIETFRSKKNITEKTVDAILKGEVQREIVKEHQEKFLKKYGQTGQKFEQLSPSMKQRFQEEYNPLKTGEETDERIASMTASAKAERKKLIRERLDKRFEDLLTKARELVEESKKAAEGKEDHGSEMAKVLSYEKAIIDLASGRSKNFEPMRLGNYVKMYSRENPSNEDIAYYIRNASRSRIKFGLDLRGGTEFTIVFNAKDIPLNDKGKKVMSVSEACDQIMETLRRRVDPHGMKEVEVRKNGVTSITIKTPSKDPAEVQRILSILLRQGKLNFYLVHPDNESLLKSGVEKVAGYMKLELKQRQGPSRTSWIWVEDTPGAVDGSNVVESWPGRDEFGKWMIHMKFDTKGGNGMGDLTARAISKENKENLRMAIVLDGIVYSAPVVQGHITQSGQITGDFSQQEARSLSIILRSGSLPVKTHVDSVLSTNPTLGKAFVDSGLTACLTGMLLVVVFMLIWYRLAGLIAVGALAINVLLIFGTLPILDAALTLPGIAGVVLTIGMAVDANVLIFERIREELSNGKGIPTAVKNGYNRAFITIIDANLTTLFTAFFLYKFGSETIKGFAVTLSVGIVASMFTALFVTRWVFDLLIENEILKNKNLIHARVGSPDQGGAKAPDFQFITFRKAAGMGSIAMIVLSLVIFSVRREGALSVDFMGGALISMTYDQQINASDINKVLAENGFAKTKVTYKASVTTSLIDIVIQNDDAKKYRGIIAPAAAKKPPKKAGPNAADDKTKTEEKKAAAPATGEPTVTTKDLAVVVRDILNEKFPEAKFRSPQQRSVGSTISSKFTGKAILSIFFALLAIIIYISFRFEFTYALGAVAALGHDVIICSGIFLAWGLGSRQISLTVIAALLTIIGYSLNDTIVVFDRIRENIDLNRKKKIGFLEIVNASINQTLSRTLLTSLTTLLVVLMLFIVGGGAVNDFALMMIAGVIVGTYSSIFIATPVMILARQKLVDQAPADGRSKSSAQKAPEKAKTA